MKIFILTTILLVLALSVRPPTPSCRVNPLPELLPITLGETQRFDMEGWFTGYNISIEAYSDSGFVTSLPKFQMHQKRFDSSMNFTSAKLYGSNRFLATHTDETITILYVGMNDEQDGITIQKTLTVESVANTKCFDVEEVYFQGESYAIIDCATFIRGQLMANEFYYVNLNNYTITQGRRYTDVFVHYNRLEMRYLATTYDPRNNITYLYRTVTRDAVSQDHLEQTYMQIFEISEGLNPYLIEVIDHTVFDQKQLSIADVQIYEGLIYILNYNRGLFEIRFTGNQKIEIRSVFNIKMDVSKFRVSRLGFNDDLNVVFTNGNTVYQYDWIIGQQPTLTTKYNLMPQSEVQHIFVDENFVIVSAKAYYQDDKVDTLIRKIWIFTRFTPSYTNVFTSFDLPLQGNFLMHYHEHIGTLSVFGNYLSRNIKFMLPFIMINPLKSSIVGTQFNVSIVGTSIDNGTQVNCTQMLRLKVLDQKDTSIIGTQFTPRNQYVVDSPDSRQLNVGWTYFGPNLEYDVKITTNNTDDKKPFYDIEKVYRNFFKWPGGPDVTTITFIEMFELNDLEKNMYGFVQDSSNVTYYISCNRTLDHTMNCKTLAQADFGQGKISQFSQSIDRSQRRFAVIFQQNPDSSAMNTVYVYGAGISSLFYYGSVSYSGAFQNQLTSVAINKGMLLCTFTIGKRVDVFRLEDVQSEPGIVNMPKPLFRITSQVMRFFGVSYFAPVDAQASAYHGQTLFVKTKTGLIAMGINQLGFPSLLFTLPVMNDYNFEVARDSILIIEQDVSSIYRIQTPIRRNANPILLQTFRDGFTLGEYSELVSDQLFYVVSNGSQIDILHPNRPSTSIYYDVLTSPGNVRSLDAVRVGNVEYLFVVDRTGVSVWEIYFEPTIKLTWGENQPGFTLSYNAKNNFTTSNVLTSNFTVFNTSESAITPTEKYNATKINNTLVFPNPKENSKVQINNITFEDRDWFNGTILHYRAECPDCGKNIFFENHVHEQREILAARAIYDIESTYNGLFAQQYDAVFKTYRNDSIQSISRIPTQQLGHSCAKIGVPEHSLFVVSLCQTGTDVAMFLTSYISEKPFTWGPSSSEALQVNTVTMIGQVMMIVDNEDNPFVRQGGIYLYHLNLDMEDPEQFTLLDVIESDDLQIEGFQGMGFITSADLHRPSYNSPHYRLVLTEGRTGGIFIFTFQISADQQQIIYISKSYINIHDAFDKAVLIPEPLRIYSVSIVSFMTAGGDGYGIYRLLLTVANWHHIQLRVDVSNLNDTISTVKVNKLYERYPWELVNYVQVKKGSAGFFAVPYINMTLNSQLVAVYDTSDYAPSSFLAGTEFLPTPIPVSRMLGAHWIPNIYQVSFDFNRTDNTRYDNLIFVDVDSYNLTQLKINRNLTVSYRGSPPNQTITLVARNSFHEFPLKMKFGFRPIPVNEETVEIIWIIILVVGSLIISGLLLICIYQIKKESVQALVENKQSLITRDSTFQNAYINRSSVDPSDTPFIRESREETEKIQSTEVGATTTTV